MKKSKKSKKFLSGNEAIAWGAINAGIDVATTYPGTPASEIGDTLFRLAEDTEIQLYFEYSVNEKVAMEIAASAAATGVRSLVCMKHVGLNVASDVLMTLAYIGIKGGMVIVVADDPSMHSSQNEQDSRVYAKFAGIPMLEPSTPQEAMDMTMAAFDISELLELPVMIRTTTRISHTSSVVYVSSQDDKKTKNTFFKKDKHRWVPIPPVSRIRHKILLKQIEKAEKFVEKSEFNQVVGSGLTGIIASGIAIAYTEDALNELDCWEQVTFLKLGFTYPHSQELFCNFLNRVNKVLIIEELEPFQEDELKIVAQEAKKIFPILGKRSKHFSKLYELTPKQVKEVIADIVGIKYKEPIMPKIDDLCLKPIIPSLCSGCPHKETYLIIKKALVAAGLLEQTFSPTDIGCYTLGIFPPIEMADYLICMGSSIGSSCGFSVSTKQKIVAFIGDSTFFHSGVPALINAVHNKHVFCLVILDNQATAMTGFQPNSGDSVSIKKIVEACGVRNVIEINPYKKNKWDTVIKDFLIKNELSVVISKAPCIYLKK